MTQRYFRSDEATYEAMRHHLNAAWGLPTAGTQNCILPADHANAPRDASGRVYLAVNAEWCDWPAVSAVLPDLLASGAVQEVIRDEYVAAMPVV